MIRIFEIVRMLGAPFRSPLEWMVHRDLRDIVLQGDELLDVNGGSSPYTMGLPARVTLMRKPQRDDDPPAIRILPRRSNIVQVLLEDFRFNTLPEDSFDIVTCIDSLACDPEDERFIAQLARVVRPGGIAYLTTPNGDASREPALAVGRYGKLQLETLCRRYFHSVQIRYGMRTDALYEHGHKPMSPSVCAANLIYKLTGGVSCPAPELTAQLVAVLRRPNLREAMMSLERAALIEGRIPPTSSPALY